MAIPKPSSSPPTHPAQLFASATAANAARKSPSNGAGKDHVKQRANYYVSKLADRDTEAMAVAELESMARALPAESLSPFISAISDTRSSDKSPLRRHCLRLLSLLSRTHNPTSISPFLPRMLASVLRRLRDPDSSVRAACVDAVREMASCGCSSTPASFYTVFVRPISESLLLEQDHNAQIGSAMCLAAAVEEAPPLDRDLVQQLHRLLPRLVKLAASEGFKAKPALLSLLGSIVSVGGASTPAQLDILVPCLADALSNDDWAARKAASESLTRVASTSDCRLLSGFRSTYFSFFQSRRFDKVKIVRETMNQMLEAWKDVPGALGDDEDQGGNSSSSQSRSSSARRESESYSLEVMGTRTSGSARSCSPTLKKHRSPISRSPPTDASPIPRRTRPTNEKRASPPVSRNLELRKTPDWKVEIAIPREPPFAVMSEVEPQDDPDRDGRVCGQAGDQENEKTTLEVKRLLCEKNSERRVGRLECVKPGSHVIPYQENENSKLTTETDELFEDNKDSGMSLIREQLVQIENQQSTLLDLVQRFIGDSQNGIHSLETRVHGLEMALEEISYDWAMSSGRVSSTNHNVHCCKIPGAEFLSSKFWRRNEGRYSSRYTVSGTSPSAGFKSCSNKGAVNSLKWEKQGLRANSGFVVNPLAEGNYQSGGSPFVTSGRMPKSSVSDPGSRNASPIVSLGRLAKGSVYDPESRNADENMIDDASTVTSTADMISRSSRLI